VSELVWLEERDALVLHGRLLAEHGGAGGIRDEGLLASALARPQQHHAYGKPDLFELAALYTAAIIRDHPFVDGNKRTGFVLGALFLALNGYTLAASEEEATHAVLTLAAGESTEADYGAFLRGNTVPARNSSRRG
jgi:death-on-curing protein